MKRFIVRELEDIAHFFIFKTMIQAEMGMLGSYI